MASAARSRPAITPPWVARRQEARGVNYREELRHTGDLIDVGATTWRITSQLQDPEDGAGSAVVASVRAVGYPRILPHDDVVIKDASWPVEPDEGWWSCSRAAVPCGTEAVAKHTTRAEVAVHEAACAAVCDAGMPRAVVPIFCHAGAYRCCLVMARVRVWGDGDHKCAPPSRWLEAAARLLRVVATLDDAGILHRDICPDNCGFSEGAGLACLFDFDVSKRRRCGWHDFRRVHPSRQAYTSIASHLRYSAAATSWDVFDELESVLYTVLSMLCGGLPWDWASSKSVRRAMYDEDGDGWGLRGSFWRAHKERRLCEEEQAVLDAKRAFLADWRRAAPRVPEGSATAVAVQALQQCVARLALLPVAPRPDPAGPQHAVPRRSEVEVMLSCLGAAASDNP